MPRSLRSTWRAFTRWFNRLELSQNGILLAFAGARGVSSLPVIDEATCTLRGMIGRDHILGAYETAVAEEGGARGGGRS